MTARQPASPADMDRAYQQYVRPQEQSHQGEYVLVTPDGQSIFAPTLLDLAEQAQTMANSDNFLFKVGKKVIGHLL